MAKTLSVSKFCTPLQVLKYYSRRKDEQPKMEGVIKYMRPKEEAA
jgi:hypothetical protein